MKVEIGQVWRHKPSGDVRTVFAIVTYRERTGFEPREFERMFGHTHIAVMTPNPNDRRDSSDMVLVDGHHPAYPEDWEIVKVGYVGPSHSGCDDPR